MNLEPPVSGEETAAPKSLCFRAPSLPRNRAPRAPQSLASGSHTQCRVSSCAAMHLRAGVASVDASAPGSHRSGDGGGGVVSSFKTQATPSPSRVDAAPLALRTRARWLFPPPRRRCSQLSEMIGVSNPPRSRRAYSPRPPSAPKRLTPRAPSPLRFPKILPAESWGWGCGCPRSCCCGVR